MILTIVISIVLYYWTGSAELIALLAWLVSSYNTLTKESNTGENLPDEVL